MQNWVFRGSSPSLFLHYHKNTRASSLDHYCLDSNTLTYITLRLKNRCGDSRGYSMTYHKNVCHCYHIRVLGGLGDKINHWRGNGPCIYATHQDTYVLTVNYGLPNHWVVCNGDLECSGCSGALEMGGWNNVHHCRWRWLICTRIVLFNQYGSSTPCNLQITYMWIKYSSSFH